MSIKGEERRLADLHELEQDFMEAFEIARKIPDESNFMREKSNRSRISATKLDVTLFTLESKIVRLREILGMEPFVIPMPQPRVPAKAQKPDGEIWDAPPVYDGVIYALDPSDLYMQILESQREPHKIFSKVRCGPMKMMQGVKEKTWRLASVECGEQGNRAKVILTVMPLPATCPDAEVAVQKLDEALGKLIDWCSRAGGTPPNQRPHGMQVHYTRATRDLQFAAR
jgi:hypothetical protein